MHRREPTHDGVITHLHMAGQRAVVGKNYVISDHAIMCNVAVSEEGSAVSDTRFPFARRAAAEILILIRDFVCGLSE